MHAGRNRYFNDPALVLGMYAKRPIPEGKALSIHMLQAPHLVRRGQEVILLAKTAGLEVRMKGKALADGAKGDLIQVRNTKSRRIVEGVVTNQGVVRVGM
jgi:flagella basal body P-ring formation protein FlgA